MWFTSEPKPDPRVVFSWDHKDPDHEVLQLRLELGPDIYLYWQMRVTVDMIACFGLPWDSFWRGHITDQERVIIADFEVEPCSPTYSPVLDSLDSFFERVLQVDVLTSSIVAADLVTIHSRLETAVAAPHRERLFNARYEGKRFGRRWEKAERIKLQPLREDFAAWLDPLPTPVVAKFSSQAA